jgi:DNA polymerase I-like protein with 3'-5' exonuclease and polymerase domains
MMQLPLLVPESSWRPPNLSDLPSWKGAKRIGIDTETHDPKLRLLGPGPRRGDYIAGYSFAIEDGPKFYVPLRHLGGDNVTDPAQGMQYLKSQAKDFDGEIVGTNLGYDLDFLWNEGVKFPNIKRYRDVQIAESLINELQSSYSLDAIAKKYLGVGKEESLLREAAAAYGIDAKRDIAMSPARFVGPYGEADAEYPLKILRRQERIIDDENLWEVFNLECELLPVLVKMRQRGIKIDLDRLDQIEQWSEEEEQKALDIVRHETGVLIPLGMVWRADQLAPALRAVGIEVPLTPKTRKPSIDKDLLQSINHPVAKALDRARKVNKVRSTFVNSIREHMVDGRIHCTFNQLRGSRDDNDEETKGAAYGRLSSDHPNMQQQPARDPEIGPMWRSIYLPDDGGEFLKADYSQQEPRMAVHYAVLTHLGIARVKSQSGWREVDADKSAREIADRYIADPGTDNHQMMADIIAGRKATKQERDNAKHIFLGLSYGMGGAKMCHKLGLPTIVAVRDPISRTVHDKNSLEGQKLFEDGAFSFEAAGPEGQAIIDKFDLNVPFVRVLGRKCQKAADRNGYIRTISGRKCRFPKRDDGKYDWTQKAFNRLIQGSSADQTKMAIVALDRAGLPVQLQVHDEIDTTIENRKQAEDIVKIMLECCPLKVPSKVDMEIGPNWGDAE